MNKHLIDNIGIASAPAGLRNDVDFLNWQDNAAVQGLLDVVVDIMANEYMKVARENAEVFKHSSSRSCG